MAGLRILLSWENSPCPSGLLPKLWTSDTMVLLLHIECVCLCVCVCMCMCVRERVYVDRLY